MKKIIILILLIYAISDLKAFSCDCYKYKLDSLQKISYEVSHIVFLGELISSNPKDATYTFKVYETFKGNDSLEIITGTEFSSCSIIPEEKGLWIVYADFVRGDTIDINVCRASRGFSNRIIILPPTPPQSSNNSDKIKTLEYEIELLKYELEIEKNNREALAEFFVEVERLRNIKKMSTANKSYSSWRSDR